MKQLSVVVVCALVCAACLDEAGLWGEAHWGQGHHGHHGQAGKPAGGAAGSAGSPAPTTEPRVPKVDGPCPEFQTGTLTLDGVQVRLWVGERRAGSQGSLLFYWHGTGSSPEEANAFGVGFQEILDEGGVIAAFAGTTGQGRTTGTQTWYSGDFEIADQIAACAVEHHDIDPRRIYTAGCSSGGMQASIMAYERSAYLAAAAPNSGGLYEDYTLQDPGHVPAVMIAHGARTSDIVIINFADASQAFAEEIAALGGFAVVCDHGGGHCGAPQAVRDAQWQFLKDHPFGVRPEPYAAGLPASFPSVCKIVK
ncbi:MAG TPA: hypothetical protein VJR89_02005 [Polyangiales bacterium]|nr:hypothetical protein [Polyangiales bacterium]